MHHRKGDSRRHPAAYQSSKRPRHDRIRHVPRQPAKQAPKAKDRIREDEARLPFEYIAHLAV